MNTPQSSSWPNLLPELLGLVLKRLPILADRVRLRAVCWPWRSNARLQVLPPLNPCLICLDGSFLSIPGGEIIQMPEQYDGCCYGLTDNWLFLVKSDGGCSLVNPFSRATMDLPKIAMDMDMEPFNKSFTCNPCQYKLVVSSPLDSTPDTPVSVLILDDYGNTAIGVCQPPIAFDFSRGNFLDAFRWPADVTFFDGRFYGLDCRDNLLTFDISYGLGSRPEISSIKNVINSMNGMPDLAKPLSKNAYISDKYLVECCGRLLMVTRRIEITQRLLPLGNHEHIRTTSFEIFEADLSTKPNQWRRVKNLGGQALFIGRRCSKSCPAGEGNGIQEDCIYFLSDYCQPNFAADCLGDSGVYNITNGMITPLLPETATVPQRGQWTLTWFFPADSV